MSGKWTPEQERWAWTSACASTAGPLAVHGRCWRPTATDPAWPARSIPNTGRMFHPRQTDERRADHTTDTGRSLVAQPTTEATTPVANEIIDMREMAFVLTIDKRGQATMRGQVDGEQLAAWLRHIADRAEQTDSIQNRSKKYSKPGPPPEQNEADR